jgi:sugar phosphate isomerase/epimerase
MAYEVTGHEIVPQNAPLSVQLYTIREHVPHNLASSLNRLKHLGFQAVEPFDFVDSVASYKAAADASGLSIPTAHAKLIDADLDQIVDAAVQLGIHTIIHPAAMPEQWSTPATIEALAARLNLAAARAAQAKVAVMCCGATPTES